MLPRVILFNAVSIDGRIDWFKPNEGRFYELASFWREDATLAGSETIVAASAEAPAEDAGAFNPPVPNPEDTRPLLAVVDSRGRARAWHYWRQLYWRDVVALCSQSTPESHLGYLRERHVEYIVAGEDRVDLRAVLVAMNERYGVKTVRLESGGTLNGALLRAGLVDEVSLLVSPSLVGGTSARSFFRAPDLTTAAGVIPLKLLHVEKFDDGGLWLRYAVER